MIDFALRQCRDVNLRSPPSLRAQTLFRGGVRERYICHLGDTSGHPDADDDHVKRDRDDGRDLWASDHGLSGTFVEVSRTNHV